MYRILNYNFSRSTFWINHLLKYPRQRRLLYYSLIFKVLFYLFMAWLIQSVSENADHGITATKWIKGAIEGKALTYIVVLFWYYIGGVKTRHAKPQWGKVESRQKFEPCTSGIEINFASARAKLFNKFNVKLCIHLCQNIPALSYKLKLIIYRYPITNV